MALEVQELIDLGDEQRDVVHSGIHYTLHPWNVVPRHTVSLESGRPSHCITESCILSHHAAPVELELQKSHPFRPHLEITAVDVGEVAIHFEVGGVERCFIGEKACESWICKGGWRLREPGKQSGTASRAENLCPEAVWAQEEERQKAVWTFPLCTRSGFVMTRKRKPRYSDKNLFEERKNEKEGGEKRSQGPTAKKDRWTPWTAMCMKMFSRHQEQPPFPQLPSALGRSCSLALPRMRSLPTHQHLYQTLFETRRGEISPVLEALVVTSVLLGFPKRTVWGECVSNILRLPLLVSCLFLPQ